MPEVLSRRELQADQESAPVRIESDYKTMRVRVDVSEHTDPATVLELHLFVSLDDGVTWKFAGGSTRVGAVKLHPETQEPLQYWECAFQHPTDVGRSRPLVKVRMQSRSETTRQRVTTAVEVETTTRAISDGTVRTR